MLPGCYICPLSFKCWNCNWRLSCCFRLTAINIGCMMGISNVGISIMADHAKQVSRQNSSSS